MFKRHRHTWGKWEDNFRGSMFQRRYCTSCGRRQVKPVKGL